ncbi:MAG: HAD family phosphatase [Alphaproteobacteria bacterium]|nr:HAD family phosphatase [Alphaproteobacteria bacterium]
MSRRSTVIFDLGGVLIDWNPRYLYRTFFKGDEPAMEDFLTGVCTSDWNLQQDAGRCRDDAVAVLMDRHADKRHLIDAWFDRFDEMIPNAIQGTVEILDELRQHGTPIYALTNFGPDTFPIAQRRYEFLSWFRGITVSGYIKLTKPDPRIYRHLLETYGVAAEDAVFIDDVPKNVAGAAAVGLHGIHFTDPAALRRELQSLALL